MSLPRPFKTHIRATGDTALCGRLIWQGYDAPPHEATCKRCRQAYGLPTVHDVDDNHSTISHQRRIRERR